MRVVCPTAGDEGPALAGRRRGTLSTAAARAIVSRGRSPPSLRWTAQSHKQVLLPAWNGYASSEVGVVSVRLPEVAFFAECLQIVEVVIATPRPRLDVVDF